MSDFRQSTVGCHSYSRIMTPFLLPAEPPYVVRVDSPIGRIEVTSDGAAVTSLTIERDGRLPWDALPEKSTKVLATASKQLDRVIPALELSEKDLPDDFNPPARLALAHKELGQLPLAEADIARALTKNTGGPRRVRLFDIQASIFAAKGDVAAQKKALADAIAYGKSLPDAQRPNGKLASLEGQLAKLSAPAPAPAPPAKK